MRTHFLKIIDVTDVIALTNYASQQVERISGYSVQFIWTASKNIDAKIVLQASNDGENWDSIECASYLITDTITTTRLFNLPEVYYRYFRPRVEITAGTLTTLEAFYFLKGI